jgi:PTH1 family peptidyl-tRNA hydrolase
MKLIYGLGNPGAKYRLTRHNMGFMVADLLAREYDILPKKKASGMLSGIGRIDGIAVMLAKPVSYMNLSGEPLAQLSFKPADLIVIHDDLDIPFGQVRVKFGGGTGGHKGLGSIAGTLGTPDFVRIRCGIGRPAEGHDPADYVLEEFAPTQMDMLSDEIARAAEAVRTCLRDGAQKAMNLFNQRADKDTVSPPEHD